MKSRQNGSALVWIIVILILIIGAGAAFYFFAYNKNGAGPAKTNINTSSLTTPSATQGAKSWQNGGPSVSGKFADADVVDLGNTVFRMYYAAEPETPGFNGQIYSALSTDGISWAQEEGTRKTNAIFPDVVRLPDNKYRMYFQQRAEIYSATSTDGLTWTDELGIRIKLDESKYDNIGATSTTILPDGTFLMAYRLTVNQKYQTSKPIPNSVTEYYNYATSTDGLTFTDKGIAIDSRNETLTGLADGGEWVKWDNNELRLYFWSYEGIYYSVYNNGTFSTPTMAFYLKDKSSGPPCDPTLAKVNGKWFMYYGQHTKGISYATYR